MEQDDKIDASPTKKFFVDMLTRDIDLYDAILDLLDNCVDGVHRATKEHHDTERPYDGYWAEIHISDKSFTIKDNCGGIPRSLAKDYAFRMGRPDGRLDNDGRTVGIYGIGMKRAIFKMGSKATVRTKHNNDEYEVSISPEWLNNEKNWDLKFESGGGALEESGTCIEITNLHRQISEKFSDSDGVKIDLHKAISTHYTYIINKGLSIRVCGERVEPKPLTVLASEFKNYCKRSINPILCS
ncbi:hypothetical protein HOP52_11845 [Halomonas campisalis]|uniref:Uncharacterized protein n=1 Tax=Billgrantia campisalis TaxID=74661 RepID=A0ABS9P9J2_9GAMM|nr:ATP-binding protein [Halomonas campisalis]MCG6658445.1 hypothetical protein [Halomonas campisalis]MDR5863116.1 ATP-binding protein [Halomonas campisalis]